jgi:hypothetical protein
VEQLERYLKDIEERWSTPVKPTSFVARRILDSGRMVGRCHRHSGDLPDAGENEGASNFSRMAPEPAERFKARDSARKSAARPRGEETSGQAVRVARIGSAAAGLWRRSLDSRVADDIKGIDTTDRGAGMANYEVDLSQSEFESELLQLGWAKELSLDGTVMNYAEG